MSKSVFKSVVTLQKKQFAEYLEKSVQCFLLSDSSSLSPSQTLTTFIHTHSNTLKATSSFSKDFIFRADAGRRRTCATPIFNFPIFHPTPSQTLTTFIHTHSNMLKATRLTYLHSPKILFFGPTTVVARAPLQFSTSQPFTLHPPKL